MYKVKATLQGTSSYLFSKVIMSEKSQEETSQSFEKRTWIERMHTDKDGYAQIPSRAVKGMLVDTARFLGEKIPGRGQSTFTKRFESGVRCGQDYFPMYDFSGDRVSAKSAKESWHFVPSDGKPGGGSRVWKCFPEINEWLVDIELVIVDEIIDPERLFKYLQASGYFKGLGTWRPAKSGEHGVFTVKDGTFEVEEIIGVT